MSSAEFVATDSPLVLARRAKNRQEGLHLRSWSLEAAHAQLTGGRAEVPLLPEAALRSNSHFMFCNLGNLEVATQLFAFLAEDGLYAR